MTVQSASSDHPVILVSVSWRSEDRDEERAIHDLIELYSGPQLFQARIVGRNALIETGAALKGMAARYGNTR